MSDNEKFRIDDGYFAKLPVQTQRRIDALTHSRLGPLCNVFRKGIFDIKADTYAEKGIPFVRISNLRNGLIDEANVVYITPHAHAAESATALRYGDLILSKTAYAAASFVNLSECNASQDTIAVRLSPDGARRFQSGYIAAYLNCRYGLALMQRQFQGNVQAHLSLPDGRKVPIPKFGKQFQVSVDQAYRDADTLLRNAASTTQSATETLSVALGLRAWQPPEPLTYIRRASDAFAAQRIDAEYFREKFASARAALAAAGAGEFIPLSELQTTITNGHTPLHHDLTVGEVPFLCAEHVTDFECHYDSHKRILLAHHQGELARTAVHNGDVLLTIKGRVGNFAIAENVPEPVNINQDVALVRLNDRLTPWWVVTFLNSRFGKLQVEQLSTGGINPFLGLSNVRKLAIPRFAEDLMERVSGETRNKVRAARAARQSASDLLAAAQRGVEIAIEESEAAAIAYLKSKGV